MRAGLFIIVGVLLLTALLYSNFVTHHIPNSQYHLRLASTDCQESGIRCRKALLLLINQERKSEGLAPYLLDWPETHGGSQQHSLAMAATHSIWHTNPNYPNQSFPNDIIISYSTAGENVGMESAGLGKWTALSDIFNGMMAERSYGGGHYLNLMSSHFSRIGIGIVTKDDAIYVTEDFIG